MLTFTAGYFRIKPDSHSVIKPVKVPPCYY